MVVVAPAPQEQVGVRCAAPGHSDRVSVHTFSLHCGNTYCQHVHSDGCDAVDLTGLYGTSSCSFQRPVDPSHHGAWWSDTSVTE